MSRHQAWQFFKLFLLPSLILSFFLLLTTHYHYFPLATLHFLISISISISIFQFPLFSIFPFLFPSSFPFLCSLLPFLHPAPSHYMKKSVYTLERRKRVLKNSRTALPASIFEASRRPRKKKPFIYRKDDAEQLISVDVSTSRAKQEKTPDFAQLDMLLSSPEQRSGAVAKFSSLPHEILQGNIESVNSEQVEKKYAHRAFVLPKLKLELKKRTEQHLDLIPRILAGEEELSFYYTLALQQRKSLAHTTMTLEERWNIQWEKYVGGYFGLKRQLFVSMLIQNRYKDLLSRSSNKTVHYWTPDMFATYVLANEIILRLVMDDLGVSKRAAEQIMRETVDYGCKLADEQAFADDLAFGEV